MLTFSWIVVRISIYVIITLVFLYVSIILWTILRKYIVLEGLNVQRLSILKRAWVFSWVTWKSFFWYSDGMTQSASTILNCKARLSYKNRSSETPVTLSNNYLAFLSHWTNLQAGRIFFSPVLYWCKHSYRFKSNIFQSNLMQPSSRNSGS